MDGFKGTFKVGLGQLVFSVREALQRLEHANLVIQVGTSGPGTRWRITPTGEEALADQTVSAKLGSTAD